MTDHAAGDPVQNATDIALYVHWPFCLSLCPYCDFNSHVRDTIDQVAWREALLHELDHYAALAPGRRLTSIFFGGGTPSLMPPETAAAIIARARDKFTADPAIEITLEANPTSAETGVLEGFGEAGINRLSLGIQALDDAALSALGRTHSSAEARACIARARDLFARFSFDLIYARPGQSPESWKAELESAIALSRGHLSAYQLTIEPGTPFFLAQARGTLELPGEDDSTRMFEITQDVLEAAGMPAYEISNHAVPGAESRHNLTYWQHRDYLGIGPGAHGRISLNGVVHETRQHRAPDIWLERTLAQGHATQRSTPLSADLLVEEVTMMGLRLVAGIDGADFAARTGQTLTDSFAPGVIDRLTAAGYLEARTDRLVATGDGRQRLNAVIDSLLNA
jgi:putative oxygen-independent coproporphyrinogen III oxidase